MTLPAAARRSATGVAGQAEGSASPPVKLVVVLIVDQMRADYVDRFRGDWTRGLNACWIRARGFRAPRTLTSNTVTCAGHATVSTAAFPPHAWNCPERLGRLRDRPAGHVYRGSDVQPIGYGVRPVGGDSSRWLLLPTFADETRTQRGARVVTLSLKPRSAIMLAGRAGDAVTWLSASLDGWQTVFRVQSGSGRRRATVRERCSDCGRLRQDLGATAPGFARYLRFPRR